MGFSHHWEKCASKRKRLSKPQKKEWIEGEKKKEESQTWRDTGPTTTERTRMEGKRTGPRRKSEQGGKTRALGWGGKKKKN